MCMAGVQRQQVHGQVRGFAAGSRVWVFPSIMHGRMANAVRWVCVGMCMRGVRLGRLAWAAGAWACVHGNAAGGRLWVFPSIMHCRVANAVR